MLTLDWQAKWAAFNSKFKKKFTLKICIRLLFTIFLCSIGKLGTFFFFYVTFKNVSFWKLFDVIFILDGL